MAAETNKGSEQGHTPEVFSATRWSIVKRAQDKSEAALNTLFRRYRSPLVAYVRRCWPNSPEDPEDVVQDFFAGLLRRDFLKSINSASGRFRTFLLNSLKHHLCDAQDKARALKRGGGQLPCSLDETDGEGNFLRDPASPEVTPDLEYDRAWAHTLLNNALERLRTECARTGHAALCAALEPVLFVDETAPPHREIAAHLAMTEGSVRTAASRIRDRLRGIIRDEILQTVDSEEDLRSELRYLSGLLGK